MTKIRQLLTTVVLTGVISCMHTTAFGWSLVGDFEGGVVGQKANGPRGLSEAFGKSIIVDTMTFDGTRGAQMGIDAGVEGFGQWGGFMNYPVNLYEGSELWFRISTYFPADFIAVGNPRLKFMRVHTMTAVGANDGYLDLYILPNGGFSHDNEITGVSTAENIQTGAATPFGVPLKKGAWETYEVYVKFHSQPGTGIYRVWQNGKLMHENKTLKTLKTPSSWSDRSHIFTYWNGGAPKTQSMYIDDVLITNERPGCQDSNGNYMIGPAKSSAPRCNAAW